MNNFSDKLTYTHEFLESTADYLPILEQEDYVQKNSKENYEKTKIWIVDRMSEASEVYDDKIIELYAPYAAIDILSTIAEIMEKYLDTTDYNHLAHGAQFRKKCQRYFEDKLGEKNG